MPSGGQFQGDEGETGIGVEVAADFAKPQVGVEATGRRVEFEDIEGRPAVQVQRVRYQPPTDAGFLDGRIDEQTADLGVEQTSTPTTPWLGLSATQLSASRR